MSPFKTKVLVDHYELMGYILKSGDTLYAKSWNGNFVLYGELVKFDATTQCWYAKTNSTKTFPIKKVNHYIEIVVIPFDQYVKKISSRQKLR